MSYDSDILQRNKKFDEITLHVCKGCGITQFLSRAHIIRVGYRKELEMELENMAYLCLTISNKIGCHKIWDDGTLIEKKKLFCFDEFMVYIKEKDIYLYNRILQN